jgi:hypothetical protein
MREPIGNDEAKVWKPEAKPGRPRKKFTVGQMRKIILALKGGATRSMAARWSGINFGTFRSRYDQDARFRQVIDDAESHWEISQMSKITTDKDPKSARWALGHHPRTRAQFGDNQIGGGNNIAIMGALPPGADIRTMLDHLERRRLDPNAPRDPRPALVAAQKVGIGDSFLESPITPEAVDAEIVPAGECGSRAVPHSPKRTPVPATKEFIEGLEQRRAQGSDHRA